MAVEQLKPREMKLSGAKRSGGLVKTAYLAVRPSGRLIELFLPGVAPVHELTRGVCIGMSEDSRRRLSNLLHSIDRDCALPIMLTLTFPAELRVTPAESKQAMRSMFKRLERLHPKLAAVWRLEAHPELSARLGRVHPHIHCLVWGAWFDLEELSRAWTEVVWSCLNVDEHLRDESGSLVREKHLRAGTNCERIKKWAGVVYCAKRYLAKAEEYPLGEAGRVWGWFGKQRLPISAEMKIPLGRLEIPAVIEAVRAWMRGKRINSEYLLRSIYCEAPMELLGELLVKVPHWRAE